MPGIDRRRGEGARWWMRISQAGFPRVGLDLGTSAIKAAAWASDGRLLATAERPAPPLRRRRGLEVQDPERILARAVEVLAALGAGMEAGMEAGIDLGTDLRVAFTAQRDTLLLVAAGSPGPRPPAPVSALLSWRERRAQLSAGGTRALSLEGWILECWDGGIPVRGFEAAPFRYAGGDKNCEYLALGVRPNAPGVGAISLGSAISLGMAVGGERPPDPIPGVVVTPMAGSPPGAAGWNVETGVLSGMGGRDLAARLAGVGPWRGELPAEPGFRLVPHFGGALDDPDAVPAFEWADGSPLELAAGQEAGLFTPASVAGAWAEGVALELARLRPRLEQVAGTPLSELRLAGGGARIPGWARLFERAMGLPVTEVGDAFAGCRGAVIAAGWAQPTARMAAGIEGPRLP